MFFFMTSLTETDWYRQGATRTMLNWEKTRPVKNFKNTNWIISAWFGVKVRKIFELPLRESILRILQTFQSYERRGGSDFPTPCLVPWDFQLYSNTFHTERSGATATKPLVDMPLWLLHRDPKKVAYWLIVIHIWLGRISSPIFSKYEGFCSLLTCHWRSVDLKNPPCQGFPIDLFFKKLCKKSLMVRRHPSSSDQQVEGVFHHF